MRTVIRILAICVVLLAGGANHGAADDSSRVSLAGKLLVADTSMSDPRFAEAVIYLVHHDAQGAFGLIINKPLTKLPLAKLFSQLNLDESPTNAQLELFFGGPVQEDLGFVLHSPDFSAAGATLKVDGGFSVSGVRQVLRAIAEHKGPRKALFAIGYAGWGPDQLEAELKHGDWDVIDADETLIFDVPVSQKWQAAHDRRTMDL